MIATNGAAAAQAASASEELRPAPPAWTLRYKAWCFRQVEEPWADEAFVIRFRSYVREAGADDCWLWQGTTAGRKYGRIMLRKVFYPAHAMAWVLHHRRAFPIGLDACHSCDNSTCVNPAHIWPGSRRENMQDCASKNRASGILQAVKSRLDALAARTHCAKGHPLTQENLRIATRTGWRQCRTCDRERMRRVRAQARLRQHSNCEGEAA